MARKSSNNGPTQPLTLSTTSTSNQRESSPALSSAPGSPERPKGPLSVIVDSRDTVKVNNANPSELKNACDDALKRVRVLAFMAI
ncbi:hypothetical protein BDN72DRAFT_834729 [Pluteus cervinus]|uniref:Uncharacterized protein n=1 Tax=Pluteus cervinus TaxID=181527 RepID=A0ACD3B6M0_9AGAR|nr:hypothetical protein BDN72DRAFT_834729 [Pluteus cervinus]